MKRCEVCGRRGGQLRGYRLRRFAHRRCYVIAVNAGIARECGPSAVHHMRGAGRIARLIVRADTQEGT